MFRSFPVCMFQISDRVWSLVQSGVRAERVHRPVYSAEVKDATETAGSVQRVRPCFQSAYSFFSGWCCPWRTTHAFLKQSQSSSSIQESLLLTPSLWREWVRLSVESLNTFRSVKFTSHRISQHATPTLKKMELFIQRNIIYTIYTKGLLCISSLLLFISIEILHVHASVNTGLQDGLKHDPVLIICVLVLLLYHHSGTTSQSTWEIFPLFSSISFPICSVYHCPSCIDLHGKRLYLNKYCLILHKSNVSSLFCQ